MQGNKLTLDDVATIRFVFADMYGMELDPTKEGKIVEWWFDLLKDYPREVVKQASMNVMKRVTFRPTVADICNEIKAMTRSQGASDSELWQELSDVLWKVAHNANGYKYTARLENGMTEGEWCMLQNEKIFQELSPVLREYLADVSQLVHLALMDADERRIERNVFQKRIGAYRERVEFKQTLPPELKELFGGGQLAIGGGEDVGESDD